MQVLNKSFVQFEGLLPRSASRPCCRPSLLLRRSAAVRPFVVEATKRLNKGEQRDKRHQRIRKRVEGTPERPRLSVFRSNNHIYAQVIDDTQGHTLAAASTLVRDIKAELQGDIGKYGGNKDAATAVGKKIAEACLEKGILKVCFDRGGFKYHGRVKALADAAREGGLSF